MRPITTGEIPLSTEGLRTSVLMPVIVILRFFDGLGFGDEEEDEDCADAPTFCDDAVGLGGGRSSLSRSSLTLTDRGDRCSLWSAQIIHHFHQLPKDTHNKEKGRTYSTPNVSEVSAMVLSECSRFRAFCLWSPMEDGCGEVCAERLRSMG